MKTFLFLSVFLLFGISLAHTKPDPNLKKVSNKATVVAPGCTEFIHPCSGQASTALLNSPTVATTSKAAIPINSMSKAGNKTK